jgi:HAE1 family hydrophobic/amphiphilic exporter-1
VSLDGKQAVGLDISRQSGTNTVKVIDTVKARLRQIQKTLPPDIQIEVIKDDSRFIQASVDSLLEHLLYGSLLASLVVLLFIRDWRSVLIASLAIPSSLIATFTAIRYFGFTLNNMTLLALTLAVGIVIDDALIVLENIFRYIEEKGYPPMEAAVVATKEIGLAVMATTLSLVIIFLPVAFITGFARRFLYQFGITMAAAILVSLLVGFTLTPMMSSRLLKKAGGDNGGNGDHKSTKETKFFSLFERLYGRMLRWSLHHRLAVVAIAILTGLSVIPLNRMVGREWIPSDDQSEFEFIFDTPEGTSLEGTIAASKKVEEKLKKIPEIVHIRPLISDRVYHCHIYIRLAALKDRKRSNLEIAEQIRQTIAPDLPGFQPRLSIPSALGGGENNSWAIQMNLVGPDYDLLTGLGTRMAEELKKIPAFQDVQVNLSAGGPEFQVKIDRAKAADLGVRVSDVSSAMRLLVSGEDQISTYREGDNQYEVKMVLLEKQRSDPTVLSRLMIPSGARGQVRLDSFATLQRGQGPSSITRLNRQYQGGLNLNLASGMSVDKSLTIIGQVVKKMNFPPGYRVRYSGQVKNLNETTENLILALLLAVIFMYMVLAAQFENLLHPLIIMLALPLSLPFALLTLYLTGRTLNLWSALGVLLLLAIVKKNGILQIDYTNRLREQGMALNDAIIEANHTRLRPILMTTAAIIAGLIPTALGVGEGAQQRSAIATTIIGGQSLCLVLTLLVTPVAYSLFAQLVEADYRGKIASYFGRSRMGPPVSQGKAD